MPQTGNSAALNRQGSGAGETSLHWAGTPSKGSSGEGEEQEALLRVLAHQVLTCLAPSPAARSHAAPMNAVFLLPAAKPLAAPHPL